MKIRWDGRRQYRAFLEPDRDVISLVSSVIMDEASGFALDGVLLLVTDAASRFCDFELSLDGDHHAEALLHPEQASSIEDELESGLDEAVSVSWRYELGPRTLQVRLGNEAVERWVSLDGGHVILGLGPDDALRVLHCKDVVSDPSGSLQDQFLREHEPSES